MPKLKAEHNEFIVRAPTRDQITHMLSANAHAVCTDCATTIECGHRDALEASNKVCRDCGDRARVVVCAMPRGTITREEAAGWYLLKHHETALREIRARAEQYVEVE